MSSDKIDERALLARYEADLAQTEDERDRLGRKSTALQRTIAGLRELISLSNGSADAKSQIDKPVIPDNAFKGMPPLDAITKFLRMMKEGQTNRAISDALKAGGYETTAKDPYDLVRNALRRDLQKPNPTVVWVDDKWELTEWQSDS
jgi:hypothetical protein